MFLPKINFPKNKTPSGRHMFTKEEDTYLKFLVSVFGTSQWEVVASMIGNRTARQCRERYKNYLSPSINNSPWTPEEDVVLLTKYSQLGPKWSQISTFFNGRTDVMVKNRYSTLTSKNITQTNLIPNLQNDDSNASSVKENPSKLSSQTSTPSLNLFHNPSAANLSNPIIQPQTLSSSNSCYALPSAHSYANTQFHGFYNYQNNLSHFNGYTMNARQMLSNNTYQSSHLINQNNKNSNYIPKQTYSESKDNQISDQNEFFNAVKISETVQPITDDAHETNQEMDEEIFDIFDSQYNEFEFVI